MNTSLLLGYPWDLVGNPYTEYINGAPGQCLISPCAHEVHNTTASYQTATRTTGKRGRQGPRRSRSGPYHHVLVHVSNR